MCDFLVEHDYKAQDKDELTIQKGDIITDCEVVEEGWMRGELRGKKDLFPDNFGKITEKKKVETAKDLKRGRIVQNYTSKSKDEISVTAGAQILILTEMDSSRQYRIRLNDGREGRVPRHCVEILSSDTTSVQPSSIVNGRKSADEKPVNTDNRGTLGGGSKVMGVGLGNIFSGNPITLKKDSVSDIKRGSADLDALTTPPVTKATPPRFAGRSYPKPVEQARALFAYTAENTDELSFEPGDIITIVTKQCEDEGWWSGEFRGHVGLFPDNFVELIPSSGSTNHEMTPSQRGTLPSEIHSNTIVGPPQKAPPPIPLTKPSQTNKLTTSASVDTPASLSSAGDHAGNETPLQHITHERLKQPGKRKPTKPLSELGESSTNISEPSSRSHLSEEKTNSTMENRPINLSRLEFIQSDELNMDTSKLLGSGAFGEVFKAEWSISEDKLQKRVVEYGGNSPLLSTIGSTFFRTSTLRSATQQRLRQIEVAVKRVSALKTGAGADTRDEVFAEAQVMASVKHPNCLPLIGICMSEGYLITAYMPKGSLDRYLSNNHQYLDPDVMFLWCQQIADGMNYLTDQEIIHRDLAARNVLLKDHDWAMITDFGLSKMLESESQREVVIVAGRVPIRWLAVETLRHGIYSAATDVWAYGITIWEIFSFAVMPYEEMETLAVRDHVLQGGRLNQPNGLSDQVFLEMYKCWAEDSDSRPTFNLLKMKFKAFGQCAQNHFVNPFRISEVETNSSILRETNRSRRNANRSLKKTSNDKLSAYPPSSFASSAGYTDMSQALSVAFDKSKATRYENIPEEHELQLQRPLLKGSEKEDALSSEASPFSDTSESAYSPTPLYSNGNQYC